MDYKKFYEFYKLELEPKRDQFVGSCPFCDDEDHFHVSSVTGMFDCKKCFVEGNHLGFITQLHQKFLDRTTKQEYTLLSKLRGIPTETLKGAKFAFDPGRERWFVPYQNGSDFLNNLGVFYPGSSVNKNKFKIFKAPELELKLYRPFDPRTLSPEIWVCEGEWDALAMYAICRSSKKACPSIVAVPGANVWKESFNKHFKGCNAVFFFDNDEAGEKGKKNITKKASGFTYAFANWKTDVNGEEPREGYDIRDVLLGADSRIEALKFITEMASEADVSSNEQDATTEATKGYTIDMDDIETIPSHSTFTKRIQENFYTNPSIMQSIEVVLATALSVKLPGEPVWLFLVGPPSSGKSRVIEAFGGSNQFFEYASKVTAESLVSGWKGKSGETESSFLPMLNGKTFFIKDLTVILGMPEAIQQKLWDILRDAYDGYLKIVYGNGTTKEFTGFKFCLVAGVTHAIHRFNDADLGARFLKVDFLGSDFDEDAHMDMAISNRRGTAEHKSKFLHTMLGYYKHLNNTVDPSNPPEIPLEISNKIKSLARIVSRMRTKIAKDRNEGMIYRPTNEVATRLALQFMNLCEAVAWVRQEQVVSGTTYQRVKKVAFDSCHELNLEVIEYIFKKGKARRNQIITDLKLPKTRVHQIVTDFIQLGVIRLEDTVPNEGGSQGRNAERYVVTEEIAECLSEVAPPKKLKPVKKKSTPKRKSAKAQR